MNSTKKVDVLGELKQGNTEVLKGFPPVVAMQYGLALHDKVGQIQDSPLSYDEVGKTMLNRVADSGIKEQIIKQMEQDKKFTGYSWWLFKLGRDKIWLTTKRKNKKQLSSTNLKQSCGTFTQPFPSMSID
ncbi:UNVERIFIED_ORG: hypothetical protein J2X74_003181 [Bacillus sp. 1751]|nr:hypothetical protein [Bacillus sp. 1751]